MDARSVSRQNRLTTSAGLAREIDSHTSEIAHVWLRFLPSLPPTLQEGFLRVL